MRAGGKAGTAFELHAQAFAHVLEANAVFATLPSAAVQELQDQWPFHVWNERSSEVRWMCSWDTTIEDVDGFAQSIARSLDRARGPRLGQNAGG